MVSGRSVRWAIKLQNHGFEVKHRKGAFNCVPDALSRMTEQEKTEVVAIELPDDDKWYADQFANEERCSQDWSRWKVTGGVLFAYKPNQDTIETLEDLQA